MRLELPERRIIGPSGDLFIPTVDELTPRILMLIEGQCEGLGATAAARKYGLSKQRYFQLLKLFRDQGAAALVGRKRGPKSDHVRTPEVVRQVIRHRFLDPDATAAVIAQKLRQADLPVSARSVERVIEEYGLQKKTLSLSPSA
jgi:transposase